MSRFWLGLIGIVAGIEFFRRLSNSAICWIDLRFDERFLILNPDASIALECALLHLAFPFGMFF